MTETIDTQAIDTDTIVAVATAPGRGGVGVIRLSGPQALTIAQTLCRSKTPFTPRLASYSRFFDATEQLLDTGLCLTFPGPASFTGEDVAELQGHGSPVVLEALVRAAIVKGARMARPGEFSERAYLNGKLDLAQAEAVADLINAASDAAARAAVRSLQGEFSRLLNQLSVRLVALRVQVEAAIDFPDEDIEILAAPAVTAALDTLLADVQKIVQRTKTGVRLTEGARLVLVGAPNVGKSSVLNRLCGEERAIVTPLAGTTRDLVREQLLLDGIPVELIDTAGLRDTDDLIEAEGVRRARAAAKDADLILAVHDLTDPKTLDFIAGWIESERSFGVDGAHEPTLSSSENSAENAAPALVLIGNKQDLATDAGSSLLDLDGASGKQVLTNKNMLLTQSVQSRLNVSAKTGAGFQELTEHLVGLLTGGASEVPSAVTAGLQQEQTYSARSRHLIALDASYRGLLAAAHGINQGIGAELVAEHLRHAQAELGSVCGEISTDELLGEIFSNFCIGK